MSNDTDLDAIEAALRHDSEPDGEREIHAADAIRALRARLEVRERLYKEVWKRAEAAEQLADGLQRDASEYRSELMNIAKAKRFNREYFDDDTAFADWAQSRARFTLGDAAISGKGADAKHSR